MTTTCSQPPSNELFPVQTPRRWTDGAQIPGAVYLAAYEVYCHLWGPQEAMVDHARGCRGGFTAGEIVAMLYARAFPKAEWRTRFEEALKGATL
jgi:hypothetical protein